IAPMTRRTVVSVPDRELGAMNDRSLDAEGFLALADILDLGAVASALERLDALLARSGEPARTSGTLHLGGLAAEDALAAATRHPRVLAAVSRLLGEGAVLA